MKLLNREPTEEMVKAGSYVLRNVSTSLTEVYQAMYDATPEINVDMKPFGYLKRVSTAKCYLGNLSSDKPQDGYTAVYSAEQVAALQAERDELLDFIKYAEVDSGVCCCGDSMENHPSGMNCGHSPVDMWDNAVAGLIAKYEGEKHG